KAEPAATFDHLGDTVDVDDLFGQFILLVAAVVAIFGHLEPQSRFTSGIGQRADAAVILVPAPVEYDEGDTVRLRAFGDGFADDYGAFGFGLALDLRSERLIGVAGGGEGASGEVIDDLSVDVCRAAEDVQPWPCRRPGDGLADAGVPALAGADAGYLAHYLPTFPALPALRRTRSPA